MGEYPFTRVEQQAITDRFLEDGWDFLLFVVLNDSDPPPKWLPKSEIRLSLQQYGLDQLLGAIKVRAQKLGSMVRSETAVGRAKRFEAESRNRADREHLLNSEGGSALPQQWESVIVSVSAKASEANKHLSIEICFGRAPDGFVLRTKNVSLGLYVHASYPPTSSRIIVQDWKGLLSLANEDLLYILPPKRIAETTYYFDYQPAYGWCWHLASSTEYYNAASLAEELLKRLLNLQERVERGEIKLSHTEW